MLERVVRLVHEINLLGINLSDPFKQIVIAAGLFVDCVSLFIGIFYKNSFYQVHYIPRQMSLK
jgi:hypothetical protein